jgi:hypothetical protein
MFFYMYNIKGSSNSDYTDPKILRTEFLLYHPCNSTNKVMMTRAFCKQDNMLNLFTHLVEQRKHDKTDR